MERTKNAFWLSFAIVVVAFVTTMLIASSAKAAGQVDYWSMVTDYASQMQAVSEDMDTHGYTQQHLEEAISITGAFAYDLETTDWPACLQSEVDLAINSLMNQMGALGYSLYYSVSTVGNPVEDPNVLWAIANRANATYMDHNPECDT